MPGVIYREYPPSAALASVVHRYWSVCAPRRSVPGAVNRVLPDGCVDIVLDLAAGGARFIGAMTRPATSQLNSSVEFLGVRFRPAGVWRLLGAPVGELTDTTALPSDLCRRLGSEIEWVADTRDPAARIRRMDQVLVQRVDSDRMREDAIDVALRMIRQSRGAAPAASLEAALGVSSRHLERRFHQRVGLSPKMLCRITRFQYALSLMRRSPDGSGAELAAAAGYFDQPHLLRDFRAFAGLTPKAYLAERRRVGFVQDIDPLLG